MGKVSVMPQLFYFPSIEGIKKAGTNWLSGKFSKKHQLSNDLKHELGVAGISGNYISHAQIGTCYIDGSNEFKVIYSPEDFRKLTLPFKSDFNENQIKRSFFRYGNTEYFPMRGPVIVSKGVDKTFEILKTGYLIQNFGKNTEIKRFPNIIRKPSSYMNIIIRVKDGRLKKMTLRILPGLEQKLDQQLKNL